MKAGFVGIGHMGLPMARNLLRSGVHLHVWNRTPERCAPLIKEGAILATSIDDLCAKVPTVLLMLRDASAMDAALGRNTPAFDQRVANRCIVHLGTTSPAWSLALERDVLACGGHYVEAPVSGSRTPAEQASLIGMLAGHAQAVDAGVSLLTPLCSRLFRCGQVPNALRLKLAVNHYLIAMVGALAETVHAAQAAGVDTALLRQVLDQGPMASPVSQAKLEKMVQADFSPQATIGDVLQIARLVADQAHSSGAHAPLIDCSAALFGLADAAGYGELDMSAVLHAFARSPEKFDRSGMVPVSSANQELP